MAVVGLGAPNDEPTSISCQFMSSAFSARGYEIQSAKTREQLQFEERQGSAGAVLQCAPILVRYRRGGCLAGRRTDGRLRRTDLWASRFF
jgi:hypothetical protein